MNSTITGPPDPLEFAFLVERFYAGLFLAAGHAPDEDPCLGGKLLYAGALDAPSRALLVAANIAGAASLAVSSDSAACKQAIRDGVVDFLVTSLDEAIRILKNEIRKRETVAVCVALAPEAGAADFARQMLDRGVRPDLLPLRSAPAPEFASFLSQGARPVVAARPDENQALAAWSVASAPAQWLPKLDALAIDCLGGNRGAPGLDSEARDIARRWLRLAPRFMGRKSQGTHLLRCDKKIAGILRSRVREKVERAEIPVPVEFQTINNGNIQAIQFAPLTR